MDVHYVEALETLRQLTLQLMLIAAGVFGVVGGFVSSSDKAFVRKWVLATGLLCFSLSALMGYILHGAIISLLYANKFDPFNNVLVYSGLIQIVLFTVGGVTFTWFTIANIKQK
ncbi:hypothetical protein [Aestuariivirga sp.]|uniref:hypothetical protein n=1 Tax=Aestuariivirga sp. TaxID=2650926 RepID=UPI003BAD5725